MHYKKANASDILKVKSLWQEVFEDTDDYILRFINHFGIENGYVCETNNEIVAMAFALPTILSFPEQLPALYVYACATKSQYRKQGIMQNLLTFIFEEACNKHLTGVFLRPANENTASYYRKLGFEDFFYRNQIVFNRKETKENAKGIVKFITPEVYYKKRLQKLEKYCFVNWNEPFFRFLYETESQFCGLENAIFSFQNHDNEIIVDELLGDFPESYVANFLFETYADATKIKFYLPGNDICCGQIKWCKALNENLENGYFSFAME